MNVASSGGSEAPAGRQRASARAAVAATSGAAPAAFPNARHPRAQRSGVGLAATAAATEVSAAYALFGTFYVGLRLPDLAAFLKT